MLKWTQWHSFLFYLTSLHLTSAMNCSYFIHYSKIQLFKKRTKQLLRSRGIYKKLGKFPENFLKFLNRIFANFKGLSAYNFLKKNVASLSVTFWKIKQRGMIINHKLWQINEKKICARHLMFNLNFVWSLIPLQVNSPGTIHLFL